MVEGVFTRIIEIIIKIQDKKCISVLLVVHH